jgi:hypothetical protein
MQRYDPEFIDPIITALQKRPARKEKAQRRILDIYQRRAEDESRP